MIVKIFFLSSFVIGLGLAVYSMLHGVESSKNLPLGEVGYTTQPEEGRRDKPPNAPREDANTPPGW